MRQRRVSNPGCERPRGLEQDLGGGVRVRQGKSVWGVHSRPVDQRGTCRGGANLL